ncbi:MAG: inosine/xanthosine triphosphatase [Woeseiaceae bacterium]
MKIVVASQNPVKIAASRAAFAAVMPDTDLEMIGVSAASGVSDQPMSDAETRRGARNRVMNAIEAQPDADFWVGLEGGTEVFDNQLMAFAWMAIQDRNNVISDARSATLPLPPAVKERIDRGMELGDANDQVFSTINSKQGGGAYGLLTHGRYTREGIYTQTLILALIPFFNELYT